MKSNYTGLPALVITAMFTLSLSHSAQAGWLDKLDALLGKDSSDTEPEEISDSNQQSSNTLTELASRSLGSVLSDEDLINGFKEALQVGSEQVVTQLGAADGFNTDELIHIPLPENLQKARSLLKRVGMESIADDLELKLNRAAEAATPEAKELFINAIKSMSFEDVRSIYSGPNDSATQYFKEKTSAQLSERMRPIIDASLAEVGALATYDQFVASYSSIPLVPDLKGNLSDYALNKSLDGIFYYLAQEEAAIRENPVKRTTDILKRVFTK